MCATTTLTAVVSLFLIAIIANTECKPAMANFSEQQIEINIQACGKELADLLATTCRLGYNKVTKTFTPASEEGSIVKEFRQVDEEKLNREKRSIIQECCEQACRWSDLLAYCFNGSSMMEEISLQEQE